jgi:hypothetical protein
MFLSNGGEENGVCTQKDNMEQFDAAFKPHAARMSGCLHGHQASTCSSARLSALTTPVVVLVWLAVLLAIAALVSVMAGFIWCALHPLVIEEWIGRDEERRLFERDMIIAQYRRGPTLATGPGKSLGKFSSTKRPPPGPPSSETLASQLLGYGSSSATLR